ncbi:1,4-dihydroxy-2-naphthoate octaprenyltransferase [Dictyobacter alpinus]|nr:1,4-dihydroxy-2-naphthoate octaprenyltransferase [Dictyobacter alpinus]
MTDQDIIEEMETPEEAPTQKTPPGIQVVDADPEQQHESTGKQEQVEAEQEQTQDEPAVGNSSSTVEPKTKKEQPRRQQAAQVVTADAVQAEEVPTIPIGSLQTLSTLEPEVSVHSVASMRAIGMPAPLVVQPSEYRHGMNEWLDIWREGVRLNYVRLSVMPVILGSALAWTQSITNATPLGHFDIVHFILALIAVIILQIGAHLINDYYDHQRGIDTSNALGPGGLIQQGLIKPTRVLMIGLVLLGIGALVGLITALAGGPLVCLFGLLVVLAAYFFSATKQALSSLGLGELVGFLVFGLLPVMGAYMIQTGGKFNAAAFQYSVPLGFLAASVIYANNMRDIEGDSHVGKKTLATLIGLRWSRIAYIVLMLIPYLIITLIGFPHGHPHFILLALWTLPTLVVAITGVLRTETSAGFNDVMRQSLKIFTMFTTFLIIGLIISALVPVLPALPAHIIPLK